MTTEAGGTRQAAEGMLATAGAAEPVSFSADVVQASPDAVTVRAEVTVDRSRYGMTWSPMRIAAMHATGSVTARFTRAPGDPSPNGTTT